VVAVAVGIVVMTAAVASGMGGGVCSGDGNCNGVVNGEAGGGSFCG
jgi:hypothetical protein